jgi:DNA-binding NarL/FixJ family response regulator
MTGLGFHMVSYYFRVHFSFSTPLPVEQEAGRIVFRIVPTPLSCHTSLPMFMGLPLMPGQRNMKRQTMNSPAHGDGPIRVAIIEDDEEIRANLGDAISAHRDFRLVGSFKDAESALKSLPDATPRVVLTDINLPGMNGVQCVRRLKVTLPEVEFIMLTVYQDSTMLIQSLMAGASGYLLKRTAPDKLLMAIREVCEGGAPMTPGMARQVVQHFRETPLPTSDLAKLTPREKDVLDQLARGFCYKEVADNLHIGTGTLQTHVHNIYEKLRVHSRTEAVVKYLNR